MKPFLVLLAMLVSVVADPVPTKTEAQAWIREQGRLAGGQVLTQAERDRYAYMLRIATSPSPAPVQPIRSAAVAEQVARIQQRADAARQQQALDDIAFQLWLMNQRR